MDWCVYHYRYVCMYISMYIYIYIYIYIVWDGAFSNNSNDFQVT